MVANEAAVILTWNPDVWKWNGVEDDQKKIEKGVPLESNWTVGRRTTIKSGTPFWYVRQGKLRGLLGRGTVLSEPFAEAHFRDPGRIGQAIDMRMSAMLPPNEPIGIKEMKEAADEVPWDFLMSSGSGISAKSHLALEKLWEDHEESRVGAEGAELDADDGEYPEGTLMKVFVNRYERSAKARAACLAEHGRQCKACGMDFRSVYGAVADGYIHVHHTTPVSQMGKGYVVDPERELVPLCANCHYVAHLRKPDPYSVKELKRHLKKGG